MKLSGMNKRILIAGGVIVLLIIGAFVLRGQLQRRERQSTYESAMQMILDEEYDRARTVLATVADYRDATVLMNYALARSEMDHGDVGQAEVMLETIPLDYSGDMYEEILAYKSRGFNEDVKTLQSTMEWLQELSEEGQELQGEEVTGELIDVDGGTGPSTGTGTADGVTGTADGPSQSATPTAPPEGEPSGAVEGEPSGAVEREPSGAAEGEPNGAAELEDSTQPAVQTSDPSPVVPGPPQGESSEAAEEPENGGAMTSTQVPAIEVPEPPHPSP